MTRIYYSDYGAVGDGVTDDFDAIIKAHAAANQSTDPNVTVCADEGAIYYISGANQAENDENGNSKSALIQTNTDWADAKFIIDDREVASRYTHIFRVESKHSVINMAVESQAVRKNQEKFTFGSATDFELQTALISLTDKTTMRYIREGPNQDNGSPQTDIFIIDKDGNIDMSTPVIWDFDAVTSLTVHPIDTVPLAISGGHFTTIANQAESKYNYYSRGISITRSNVVIDGLYHDITGELDHGAPYSGFLSISECANVTVRNCNLSAHKTYETIGSANVPVRMGTYDITVNNAIDVKFMNCRQLNDIHDTDLWGIFASNHSKNLLFDTVNFSRFDAHMGVHNAVIRNSILGHMGINLIGGGMFLLENSKVYGYSLINLREDYGSTWNGEIIVRDCEYTPRNGKPSNAVLISGRNSGHHNFGYTCYMPHKVSIDGLIIDDCNHPAEYSGPRLFGDFRHDKQNAKYAYEMTRELHIKNVTVKSGLELIF